MTGAALTEPECQVLRSVCLSHSLTLLSFSQCLSHSHIVTVTLFDSRYLSHFFILPVSCMMCLALSVFNMGIVAFFFFPVTVLISFSWVSSSSVNDSFSTFVLNKYF